MGLAAPLRMHIASPRLPALVCQPSSLCGRDVPAALRGPPTQALPRHCGSITLQQLHPSPPLPGDPSAPPTSPLLCLQPGCRMFSWPWCGWHPSPRPSGKPPAAAAAAAAAALHNPPTAALLAHLTAPPSVPPVCPAPCSFAACPDVLPALLCRLPALLCRRASVTKTLAEFRRTHQEEGGLSEVRELLSAEQWEAIRDVASPASYFV